MKIDFIIISSVLVFISFLPFILLPILGAKDKKILFKSFKETSLKLGINSSYILQWNSNIAGIDILKKQFLFTQMPENGVITYHVNLTQVREVKMTIKTSEFKLKKKVMQSLSRVDLEFYNQNSKEPVVVNVFDNNLNYTEDLEIKNAQTLIAELQKYINAKPVLRHTA
ncbi:MAG TPA: hypothetical protein VLN72_06195 [Gillisia sp.]|nr:hypothetical protein [Gillisia sp.]